MPSDRARPVVEATLAPVADNTGEIARRFHEHVFAARPELLDGVFNRGNQAEGTQQVALAGSVAAFAGDLVKTPEQLLNRIAHKHASLSIRPEQYRVVHEHLFWAIADVLGDAVTPEVAAAWDQVYRLMAYALINQERGLYSAPRRPSADRVAGLTGRGEDRRDRRGGHLTGSADRRPAGQDLPAGAVRVGQGADARRGPPAAAVQPDPRR